MSTTTDGAPAGANSATAPRSSALGVAGARTQGRSASDQERLLGPEKFAEMYAGSVDWAAAVDFKNKFTPVEGVDYGWIEGYAKDLFSRYTTSFNDLDTKAGAIVGYLGGGAGLLTVGLIVAANSTQIPVWVIVWILPSVACAFISLVYASLARKANWTINPPMVDGACKYSEFFRPATKAQAAFLGQWHLCIVGARSVVARKADDVNIATWWFVGSIAALIFPLLATIALRW